MTRRRLRQWAAGSLAATFAIVIGIAAPSMAAAALGSTSDVDGDRIPNAIEERVCGSQTCATGTEDRDSDGIPDWIEAQVCERGVRCADATDDLDGDGVPDFAEQLVCESATCSNGREDEHGNGVADWIDFVICGYEGCSTGVEDYDGNGIADAAELAACVVDSPVLPVTGATLAWTLLVMSALIALIVGFVLRRRGWRIARPDAETATVES